MTEFQTYLKDCDCKNGGVLHYKGKIHCHWCRKPYAKGGMIRYEKEHFPKEKDISKDWQIMSFHCEGCWHKDGIIKRVESSDDCFEGGGTESYHLKVHKIHSIKRLTDNLIFEVGETDNKGVIHSFHIEPSQVWVSHEGFKGTYTLSEIKKAKHSLFTTSDGVEIFEGDFYSAVQKRTFDLLNNCHHSLIHPHLWVTFSTPDKAKDYIVQNKPISLTFNEIENLFTEEEIYPYGNFINKLKEFFNKKITP